LAISLIIFVKQIYYKDTIWFLPQVSLSPLPRLTVHLPRLTVHPQAPPKEKTIASEGLPDMHSNDAP
jgi:hypothetical protein